MEGETWYRLRERVMDDSGVVNRGVLRYALYIPRILGKSELSSQEPETPVDGNDIPKIYRLVEIEYSKFGVEDFDFG